MANLVYSLLILFQEIIFSFLVFKQQRERDWKFLALFTTILKKVRLYRCQLPNDSTIHYTKRQPVIRENKMKRKKEGKTLNPPTLFHSQKD